MGKKSPRSNLRKRLLILRKKLERTASFPKKLFLGISPRRLILPPNSLRAAPAGAATCLPARQGKLSLWLPKNQEVQFGALCLKMREPFLNGTNGALRFPPPPRFVPTLLARRKFKNSYFIPTKTL